MKKKINVSDVQLGMFIDSLCGSWINHPFWRRSFLLEKQEDLDALLVCGTKELWINTDLGLDVGEVAASPVEAETTGEQEEAKPESAKPEDLSHEPPVVLTDELRRARQIHTRTRGAISELFDAAFGEGELDLDGALILVDEIRRSTARNPNAFLSLIRNKAAGDYLGQHSIAVCALMIMLGRGMELDHETIMSAGMAGLLHDIGSSGSPPDLIDGTNKLTPEEYEIVKNHPQRGWDVLQRYNLDNIIMDVCLHHHERIDGKGYPDGLDADSLSLFARMAAICDTYDSLISDTPRRKSVSPATAIRLMAKWQEGQFDKSVFHAFVKTMGMYPFGTLVKLKSGRVAVVEEQSKKSIASPVVRVFYSAKMREPVFQEWIDLSKVPDAIVSVEEPDALAKELRIDLKLMSVV